MVMWKKTLTIVLASLMTILPLLPQMVVAKTVPVQQQQTQVILPQGQGLSDEQLRETDGEGLISAAVGAVIGGAAQYASQRLKHEKINIGVIAICAAGSALAWGVGIPESNLRSIAANALRWVSRATAVVGAKSASIGQRILGGFNRYVGGPAIRLLTRRK